MKFIYSILVTTLAALSFVAAPVYAQTAGSTSGNWSGYAATNGPYSGVGGTWKVATPDTSSEHLAADATWVGIGGVSSKSLIQAGTQAIVQNGHVIYQAWYELLPDPQVRVPVAVHAGDTVSVAIRETSTNEWHISFINTTTGVIWGTNVHYVSTHASAEWIEEMPTMITNAGSGYITLDQFGTVPFTNAYAVDARGIKTLAQAGAMPVTMLAGRSVLANPSSLGVDGESFTVARTNTTATASSTIPSSAVVVRVNRTGRGFVREQQRIVQDVPISYGSTTGNIHVEFFQIGF